MNSAGKIAAALLLSGIAGCSHKVQSAAPPPAPAKVYTPEELAKAHSLPDVPPPGQANVKQQAPEAPPPAPAKPKKTTHRKAKPADSTQTPGVKDTAGPGSATTQEAAAGQPSATSPIGQLSSSSDGGSTHSRQEIQEQINKTESGLKEITSRLTSDEQHQTATQIRTFLDKAKKALDQEDLDGANTLVTKAKVLLDELTKG